MLELIDRAKVLAKIYEFQSKFNETGDSHERVAYASAEHCMIVVKATPVIEAEPVRHGQWVPTVINGLYRCSVCNFEQTSNPNQRFCSYCGAKMQRGTEDAGTDE